MRSCRHTLTIAALVVCCCGCGENPFRAGVAPEEPISDQAALTPPESVDVESPAVAMESPDADYFGKRIGQLFESVLPTLDRARELVDRHAGLPDSTRVPFKADKQSNSAQINELLDALIG